MSMLLRLAVGAALAAAVVWFQGGPSGLANSLSLAGWPALGVAILGHSLPLLICSVAWWWTAGRPASMPLPAFIAARWIRDGVGQLLPVIPLGGEIAGARLVGRMGLGGALGAAVTVVDITAETLTQALFSLLGAVAWFIHQQDFALNGYAGVGVAMMVPMALALVVAQRLGLVRLLESLADKVMPESWKGDGWGQSIHDSIVALYGRRARFMGSLALHLVAWISAIGEVWLILKVMGHPFTLLDALALESVVFAVRSAAFLVPAALGVQEGAYVLVGAALGIPGDTALALALVKRGREALLGLPALVVWQWLSRHPRPGEMADNPPD